MAERMPEEYYYTGREKFDYGNMATPPVKTRELPNGSKVNDQYSYINENGEMPSGVLTSLGSQGGSLRRANAEYLDSHFLGDRNGNKKWGRQIDREVHRDEYKEYSGSLKDKLKDAAQYKRDRRDAEERADRYDRVMSDRWGENGKIAQKEALDHDKMVAKNILTGKTKVPDADRKLLMQRLIEEKMNGGRDNLAPWVKDLNKKYNLGYSEE